MVDRLISGGQTGVDRAALDWALDHQVPCGGWCPRGRLAEDGPIPMRYPLTEAPTADYAERTEKNVQEADGILVLTQGPPTEGTAYTVALAKAHHKPCLIIDLGQQADPDTVCRWLNDNKLKTLNVAGPRESKCHGICKKAYAFLCLFNDRIEGGSRMRLQISSDEYAIFIESKSCPGNRWRLWIPECLIFDSDAQRGGMTTPPKWEETANVVTVSGDGADTDGHAARVRFVFTPRTDAIDLEMTVENIGEQPWSNYAHPALCLSNKEADDFTDPVGDRTFVVDMNGNVRPVTELMPADIESKYADLSEQHRAHYLAYNHFPVGDRRDNDDSLQKFPVSSGYIARQTRDNAKTLLFTWDHTARVDTNFNVMTCLHSHPAMGPLAPGQSVTRKGVIAIFTANAESSRQMLPAELR